MNGWVVTTGVGLVALGVAPTPDDITVVSPLIQIGLGLGLIGLGLLLPNGDKN